MAEIKKESVLKVDIMPVSEFAEVYAKGISNQAISNAMDNDKIDFVQLGRFRYVVLTEKSKSYVPNENSKRNKTRMTF